MSTNNNNYDPKKCTYENIVRISAGKSVNQMCEIVAKGICNGPHHYINMFKVYYCWLGGHRGAYIAIAALVTIFTFLWLNYIRRTYYTRPIYKFRTTLGLSDHMAEAVLVPLAYGIVPLIVRFQGAHKNMSFSFNMAATLGSMFTLTAFVIAVCAIVLKISKKADQGKILINLLFIVIGCVLMLLIGIKREVTWVDGVVFIALWIFYLLMQFMKGYIDRSKF